MTTFLARCLHGLEWVCADETQELSGTPDGITIDRREVRFEARPPADSPLVPRTADDVFVQVGQVDLPRRSGSTKSWVHSGIEAVMTMPWSDAIATVAATRPISRAPLLDVVASVEGVRGVNRFTVEQAIGPLLQPMVDGRYLPRTPEGRAPGDPDLVFRIMVRPGSVSGALRVGRPPAHRRPWKLDAGKGTLHPPMAAALVRLAALRPHERLLDPFCGDGTILVEAAIAVPSATVHGSDLDAQRILAAERNADRAGVDVELSVADAGRPRPDSTRYDVVIANPPWNLAVDGRGTLTTGLEPFWRSVPRLLAEAGRLVVVGDASLNVRDALSRNGLSQSLQIRARLSGRITDVVVAQPAGTPRRALPDQVARWQARAVRDGIVTATGF